MMLNPNPLSTVSGPPHFVDVHVNDGESISIQYFDGNETVYNGPTTIKMISQHAYPPIAMPVQVPPGHMVQQIVDENGTLRHIILSTLNNGTGSIVTNGNSGSGGGPGGGNVTTNQTVTSNHLPNTNSSNGNTGGNQVTSPPAASPYPYCCSSCCCCYCNTTPLVSPVVSTTPGQPLTGATIAPLSPGTIHGNNLIPFTSGAVNFRRRLSSHRSSSSYTSSYSKRSLNGGTINNLGTYNGGLKSRTLSQPIQPPTTMPPFFRSAISHNHNNNLMNGKTVPLINTTPYVYQPMPKIVFPAVAVPPPTPVVPGTLHQPTPPLVSTLTPRMVPSVGVPNAPQPIPSKPVTPSIVASTNTEKSVDCDKKISSNNGTTGADDRNRDDKRKQSINTRNSIGFKSRSQSSSPHEPTMTISPLSQAKIRTPKVWPNVNGPASDRVQSTPCSPRRDENFNKNSRHSTSSTGDNDVFLINRRCDSDGRIDLKNDRIEFSPLRRIEKRTSPLKTRDRSNKITKDLSESADLSSEKIIDSSEKSNKLSGDKLDELDNCSLEKIDAEQKVSKICEINDQIHSAKQENEDEQLIVETCIDNGEPQVRLSVVKIEVSEVASEKETMIVIEENEKRTEPDGKEATEEEKHDQEEERKSDSGNDVKVSENEEEQELEGDDEFQEAVTKTSPQRSPKHLLPQIEVWNLTCSMLTSNAVKLKWSLISGESFNIDELNFKVEMSCSSLSRIVYQGSLRTCRITHLQPLTSYSFKVRAIYGENQLVSNVLTLQTPVKWIPPSTQQQQTQSLALSNSMVSFNVNQLTNRRRHLQSNGVSHMANGTGINVNKNDTAVTNDGDDCADQKCAIMIIFIFIVLSVIVACIIHHFIREQLIP